MESCFVPFVTIKIKELKWWLLAKKKNDYRNCNLIAHVLIPKLFESNVVFDDSTMTNFYFSLILHDIQFIWTKCTNPYVSCSTLWSLSIRYNLQIENLNHMLLQLKGHFVCETSEKARKLRRIHTLMLLLILITFLLHEIRQIG